MLSRRASLSASAGLSCQIRGKLRTVVSAKCPLERTDFNNAVRFYKLFGLHVKPRKITQCMRPGHIAIADRLHPMAAPDPRGRAVRAHHSTVSVDNIYVNTSWISVYYSHMGHWSTNR